MSTPNAFDAKERQVIGSSRFNGYSPARSEIEIDWTFLARPHWGATYNDTMKQMMLAHAFQFVDNVLFLVGPQNMRSQPAIVKIGDERIKWLRPYPGRPMRGLCPGFTARRQIRRRKSSRILRRRNTSRFPAQGHLLPPLAQALSTRNLHYELRAIRSHYLGLQPQGIPHCHRNPAGFICGDIPPATTTQIIRLTEIYSAVIAESWGALKRKFSEQ